MPDNSVNNKRIAKNTLLLYVRMIFLMLISLYTSRVILSALGVDDYGIYNVVGGVIGMLAYINTLLAGGTSRFITICLGENNQQKLKLTFSTTVVLSLFSSILILLFGETIGLWFVNTQLNINLDRIEAANYVYQCALFSSVLTVTQAPYTASIISHERMSIYAYMSIFDGLMKLLIVFLLLLSEMDKLKLYALLLLGVHILDVSLYRIYCVKTFSECKPSFKFDKKIFRSMFYYSGWNMLGSLSGVLMNQGMTIVLNIFFGTIVNAAKGISNQVMHIIQQLYSNFQLAARPQIMKYYAAGQYEDMYKLMCNTSKYCAYLLLIFVLPLYTNIDGILNIWLVEVPKYSAAFIKLSIIYLIFRAIDEPLTAGIHAVGKMKLPNMTTAVINTLVLPITWLVCHLGGSPIVGNLILVIDAPVILTIDLWMLRRFIRFPVRTYMAQTVLPLCKMIFLSVIPLFFLTYYMPNNILGVVLSSIFSFIIVSIILYFLGLTSDVRKKLNIAVKQKLHIN